MRRRRELLIEKKMRELDKLWLVYEAAKEKIAKDGQRALDRYRKYALICLRWSLVAGFPFRSEIL